MAAEEEVVASTAAVAAGSMAAEAATEVAVVTDTAVMGVVGMEVAEATEVVGMGSLDIGTVDSMAILGYGDIQATISMTITPYIRPPQRRGNIQTPMRPMRHQAHHLLAGIGYGATRTSNIIGPPITANDWDNLICLVCAVSEANGLCPVAWCSSARPSRFWASVWPGHVPAQPTALSLTGTMVSSNV